MEKVTIAHHSDIALIVEDILVLRVSAAVLRNTSDVFRAMLGENWAEGQSLRNATSSLMPELRLPDDDSAGMKLLCAALHQRNDLIKDEIEPLQLGVVADLADKYDCTTALKHTATVWFHALSDTQIKEWPFSLVKAASTFENAHQFAKITNVLVKQGSITQLENFEACPERGGLQGP